MCVDDTVHNRRSPLAFSFRFAFSASLPVPQSPLGYCRTRYLCHFAPGTLSFVLLVRSGCVRFLCGDSWCSCVASSISIASHCNAIRISIASQSAQAMLNTCNTCNIGNSPYANRGCLLKQTRTHVSTTCEMRKQTHAYFSLLLPLLLMPDTAQQLFRLNWPMRVIKQLVVVWLQG